MRERVGFDSWLVLLAQTGSRDALDELFKSIQAPLFRYINGLINDSGNAEDILQEVFVRIYRKLRWLREPGAFKAWCYQIASRETFRYLKKERRWADHIRDEELLNSIPLDVRDVEFSAELVEQLPDLLESLSPGSRELLHHRSSLWWHLVLTSTAASSDS